MSAALASSSLPTHVAVLGKSLRLVYPTTLGCRRAAASPTALLDGRPLYGIGTDYMGSWLPDAMARLEVAVRSYLESGKRCSLWDRRTPPVCTSPDEVVAQLAADHDFGRFDHHGHVYWQLEPGPRSPDVTLLIWSKDMARDIFQRLYTRRRYVGRTAADLGLA